MELGTEAGLSPGNFVLDGDPAPRPLCKYRGRASPIFDPCLLRPNGWITMPLGTEVGLGTDDIVLDGDAALPPHKEGQNRPPNF